MIWTCNALETIGHLESTRLVLLKPRYDEMQVRPRSLAENGIPFGRPLSFP